MLFVFTASDCKNFNSTPVSDHIYYGIKGCDCKVLKRTGYIACHDKEKKVSLWTSYKLTIADLENPVEREDNFAPDPDLPAGDRAEIPDYKGSGYHRGHLAPADDLARTRAVMDESFYLSNMVPQNGSMNSGKWRSLESRTQRFCLKKGQIWVITGPIFEDIDSDGDIDPSEEIGTGKVWKPAAMYKIIVYPDGESVNALAFIMPNKKPPIKASIVNLAFFVR